MIMTCWKGQERWGDGLGGRQGADSGFNDSQSAFSGFLIFLENRGLSFRDSNAWVNTEYLNMYHLNIATLQQSQP